VDHVALVHDQRLKSKDVSIENGVGAKGDFLYGLAINRDYIFI
jgi:hypothetical protein